MQNLFLYGPPGSGKTTLGKILAGRLDLPFVDLDRLIQNEAGQSVKAIFASEGEAGFRAYEKRALEVVAGGDRAVIALGGGALLDPACRAIAEKSGVVVCLDCPIEILQSHIALQPGSRPLLANGLSSSAASLAGLLEARKGHYASFRRRLPVAGRSLDELAEDAETLYGAFRITSGDVPSDLVIGANLLGSVGEWVLEHDAGKRAVVVGDANTFPLYGERVMASLQDAGIAVLRAVIPAGEATKNVVTVQDLWRACLGAGLERGDTVIAVGGGIVGDLAGFAAATWLRGIRWINIPTSLLAMVDSSTGGKTGADLPEAKNMIGAFHSPALVLADVETLLTLPVREFRCGLAEAIKHAIIGDPGLVDLLPLFHGLRDLGPDETFDSLSDLDGLAAFVSRAVAVKVRCVREDPFEKGIRAKLNLGHTVGHAVEIATKLAVEHGEAVAIGTVEEARIAERMGLGGVKPGWADEVAKLFASVGLPTALPPGLTLESLAPIMAHDKKKKDGQVRFSLPLGMGDVSLQPGVYETLGLKA